jgi:hypothetical protein
MYIGVTIGLQKEFESIWINGIKMNAIFLANVLQQTGHKVVLLDTSQKIKEKELNEKVVWDSKRFPVKNYWTEFKKIDVLIELGTSLRPTHLDEFKATGKNKKVIKYQCGNNYVIDMERVLFAKDPKAKIESSYFRGNVDEVWYVPQQGHQNHDYYRILNGLEDDKVFAVPFVWDPMFIDAACEGYSKHAVKKGAQTGSPIYLKPDTDRPLNICIYEPNMNVVKYALLPLLIAEEFKREGGNIGLVNVMSGSKILKNDYFKSILYNLDLVNPGDTNLRTFNRKPVVETLANHADIVVSHQWENPLNYAYLDCLYLQYPLVHNADMIQDAGYYYPECDLKTASAQLKKAADTHGDNLESYNEQSEKVLTRYTVFNEKLVQTYKKLLDNLIEGKNKHKLSHKYNWKTNLYK